MKKKRIKDTPQENEHFTIVDENGKRIPPKWLTDLANLTSEAKKRMSDRMKEFSKNFKIKRK